MVGGGGGNGSSMCGLGCGGSVFGGNIWGIIVVRWGWK